MGRINRFTSIDFEVPPADKLVDTDEIKQEIISQMRQDAVENVVTWLMEMENPEVVDGFEYVDREGVCAMTLDVEDRSELPEKDLMLIGYMTAVTAMFDIDDKSVFRELDKRATEIGRRREMLKEGIGEIEMSIENGSHESKDQLRSMNDELTGLTDKHEELREIMERLD